MISKRFSGSCEESSGSSGSGVYARINPGKIYTQFDFWAYGGEIRISSTSLSGITTFARGAYFFVPEELEIDQLGLNISSSASGQAAKIGFFEVDSSGIAQDLVVQTGELDCSATGNKVEAISATTLSKGVYLPAITATSTSVSVSGISFRSNYGPKTFFGESSISDEVCYGMKFSHMAGSAGSMNSFPANASSSFDSYFKTYGAGGLALVGVRAS